MISKDKKNIYIAEMKDFFKKNSSVFVTHYQGLTVKQIDALREEMGQGWVVLEDGLTFSSIPAVAGLSDVGCCC